MAATKTPRSRAKTVPEDETAEPVEVLREDRFVLIGEEHRDATHDPGFELGDDTLPQHEPFVFDYDADPERVEHVAVVQKDNGVIFEINGRYYAFDAQLSAATRRLFQSAVTNLNL